ncbi:MarR family transcriptional regulator [Clostridium carboxidivorans P7]|uniref:Transcriptional regulator, MarR family n=2 Tax=Clostridium TaxID=1485 RepID=C6PWJ7_9CLOT|nr:MarR family transcriptional regulator [Clostridium carboxidivorans]AKN33470.1 MarR family transcriptional regulator [Clostridium carboxidivorans P7]EET86408.1 transcriptional regulator, MarR family [Clostridium carboxidivorans P7]EFG89148.1 transcriptional regulator, MarR family [Clostridium carboxidivorans P7]
MGKEKIYEIIKEVESISKLMNKKVNSKESHKRFTISELMVMSQLRLGEAKTLSEISQILGIPNSTTSVVVDRLVKMGMIKRERDKEDRRKVLVCIKGEGIEQQRQIFKYHMDQFGRLFENATEEEIDYILNGLKTLESVIMRD